VLTRSSKARRKLLAAANDNDPSLRHLGPRRALRRNYLVLFATFVGVALVYWLAILFVDWDRIQSCTFMGKRNCIPPLELDTR
jgi:hypothetical protein